MNVNALPIDKKVHIDLCVFLAIANLKDRSRTHEGTKPAFPPLFRALSLATFAASEEKRDTY